MILDTHLLIDAVSPRCPQWLRQRLRETPGPFYTTAASWGEISHGLAHLTEEQAQEVLQAFLHLTDPALQILHIDQASAEIFGRLRGHLERIGQRLPDMDLLIASVALRYGMVLVTGNTRHFSRIPGLRLENWLTED